MKLEEHEIATAEQAYQSLAIYLMDFIGARKWNMSGLSATVTPRSVTLSDIWLTVDNKKDEKALGWGDSSILKHAVTAVRFLRDDLLATTGERIWGLTFTLHSDGKFKIEYDYNKPEDYEETDETISGDEINQRLRSLGL